MQDLSPSPSIPPAGEVPQRAAPGGRPRVLLVVLLLLSVGWAAYFPVTGFDFIPLDDPGYVYENQAVRHGLSGAGIHWAFTATERSNWHPLTWLSLMADYELYGLRPGGYHLTNLLMHEAATVLLFLWLLLATRRLWPSAAAALLFCIHPAHVESVAWVTERKDVLSTIFLFLVLLAYTRYAQTKKPGYYLAAAAALVLGLLAKPMLVTVPPLLLLLDAWPLNRWQRRRDLPRLAAEKIPFMAVAAASCVVTFMAQRHGGAAVPLGHLPAWWRFGGAVTGYAAYLGELFWPVNLGVFYPYWAAMPGWRVAVCLLGLLGITAGAVAAYRARPYLLIGWLWFLGVMVPVVGLVQVGSQSMADRYTYQPYIGLFIALCWTAAAAWERLPGWRPAFALAGTAAFAACLGLCVRQVGYWRDGVSLLEHTLAVARPSSGIRLLLADAYRNAHRYADAEALYRDVFKSMPAETSFLTKMGYLYLEQGRWEEAAGWLRRAAGNRDADAALFNDLGYALNRLGRSQEAVPTLRRSLELNPRSAGAHSNLAEALLATGEASAATAEDEAALAIDPNVPDVLARLAWSYSFAERFSPVPQRAARSLVLARRAVTLTEAGYLSGLDALAAAQASTGEWESAGRTARAAFLLAARQGSAPDVITLHSDRLRAYEAGCWPEH